MHNMLAYTKPHRTCSRLQRHLTPGKAAVSPPPSCFSDLMTSDGTQWHPNKISCAIQPVHSVTTRVPTSTRHACEVGGFELQHTHAVRTPSSSMSAAVAASSLQDSMHSGFRRSRGCGCGLGQHAVNREVRLARRLEVVAVVHANVVLDRVLGLEAEQLRRLVDRDEEGRVAEREEALGHFDGFGVVVANVGRNAHRRAAERHEVVVADQLGGCAVEHLADGLAVADGRRHHRSVVGRVRHRHHLGAVSWNVDWSAAGEALEEAAEV
mmetsp:Transcript_37092/g.78123  ORF Transcript_37092/g.78123 Transcript_37092/m.78123 type:complete len:267 (+) Transcript_37092:33-833(+)